MLFDLFSDPYVTSYPIITTRGRPSDAFKAQESFFIKYIVKFPPQIMGTFQFRVWEGEVVGPMTTHLKLCKLQVQHIGENMPCTKVPSQSATEHDSIKFWNNNTDNSCGVEPAEGGIEFVVGLFKSFNVIAIDSGAITYYVIVVSRNGGRGHGKADKVREVANHLIS